MSDKEGLLTPEPVRKDIADLATSIARTNLLSLGTCVGKFTKTGKVWSRLCLLGLSTRVGEPSSCSPAFRSGST